MDGRGFIGVRRWAAEAAVWLFLLAVRDSDPPDPGARANAQPASTGTHLAGSHRTGYGGRYVARLHARAAATASAAFAAAASADDPARPGGACGFRPLRSRGSCHQRRGRVAGLYRQARCRRRLPPGQGGSGGFADLRAAAGQLCRSRELGSRQRGQGRAIARRDGARSLRNSRRRHPARRPRRRRAHPERPDIVRCFQRQPVQHRASGGRSRTM